MSSVLVVDDNADACDLMVRLLRKAGYDASSVTGGGAALAQLRVSPPDVLVLDLMMPGVDGAEVLRRIRKEAKYDELVVIAYSAIEDPKYIRHVLAEGADDYWVKSKLNYDDLHRRVGQLIASRTGAGPSLTTPPASRQANPWAPTPAARPSTGTGG